MYTVQIIDGYGGKLETYPVKQKELALTFAIYFGRYIEKKTRKGKCAGKLKIEVIEYDESQSRLRDRSQYL